MIIINKQPVSYLQTDKSWKYATYAVSGENTNIGESGCGPTSAAMLITTLTGNKVTPRETCAWALSHGYKALYQGTYHSYFVPQFKEYGIDCIRLNTTSIYGDKNAETHAKAIQLLKQGYYIIALMGKGLWTNSGHYIVVWDVDNLYHINDPYSTKDEKLNGDPTIFKSQVKYYWAIDARKHNKEDDDKMTGKDIFEKLSEYLDTLPISEYANESSKKGVESGLFSDGNKDGLIDNPRGILTREQLAVVFNRAGLLDK